MGSPKLNTQDCKRLGKKLIESGALMEAGVAAILQAESEKIETLIEKDATICDLKQANEDLKEIIDDITSLEGRILKKIKWGICLSNCECDCETDCDCDDQCDDQCDDDDDDDCDGRDRRKKKRRC